MATIYRFIVEQRSGGRVGGDGRTPREPKIKAPAKGRYVSIFGGEKGGVEHNRKLRAINPLINRATGGAWEKGMRVGRAATGLITRNTETGKLGLSGPAIAIIIAFVLQILMKWLQTEQLKAKRLNAQNFKQMENGIGAVNGPYEIITSKSVRGWWTGLHTYNQNK